MRATLLALVVLAAPARAFDFAINVGALEVVLIPTAHGGFYPYLGVSIATPLGHDVTFIASLSYEWSFDQKHGGLVVVTTLDFLLGEHVGLDLNFAFIHDQPGLRFAEAEFYLGAGPGLSFLFGKWSISPFLNFFGGLRTESASVVPGINVSRTF
jgi:hypothetical protein